MKPTPKSHPDLAPLLAFGAHPDDIEFGCGGVIAKETRAGRAAHFVIGSRGEAGSHGTPVQRVREAKKSAAILGATVEFIELDGDAHLEVRAAHAIKLAGIIRRVHPGIVLAPSLAENQHPDHAKLGQLVRDACRLARYGGLKELRRTPAHADRAIVLLRGDVRGRAGKHHARAHGCLRAGSSQGLDLGNGGAHFANIRPQLRGTATDAGATARIARGRRPCHCLVSQRPARSQFAGAGEPQRAAILIWLPAAL